MLNSNAGGGVWPSSIYILQDFCTHGQKHKLKDTREGNMETLKRKKERKKKKSSSY